MTKNNTTDDVRLSIKNLEAFYGESQALHGLDLEIRTGELVTLLGRNGAGKSTTLRSIMGLLRRTGSITLDQQELIKLTPDQIARKGLGYIPEERGIFSALNVQENMLLPPIIKEGGLTLDEIYELFPNLLERQFSPGTKLSGGEQQMLAMGRILRTGANFLLMDEPTEGLAPVIIQYIGQAIRTLKKRGFTILLVEQNFRFARTVADRHYVVENGRIVDHFDNHELSEQVNVDRLKRHLGV